MQPELRLRGWAGAQEGSATMPCPVGQAGGACAVTGTPRTAGAASVKSQIDRFIQAEFDKTLANFNAMAADAALRAALGREVSDATVVIVAQRVSTIRDADRIVVLDEGEVVGEGTHSRLMADNPTYREIVLSQLTEQEAAA